MKGSKTMKKDFLKKTLVTTIAMITAGTCSSSVMAETIRATTTEKTNGTQKITITAQGYTDLYEPSGGVHLRTYGVRAFTVGYKDDKNDITTQFNIEGSLHTQSTSTPFTKSNNGEICDYYNRTTAFEYSQVTSKITTNSSTYGTSTQECNYTC